MTTTIRTMKAVKNRLRLQQKNGNLIISEKKQLLYLKISAALGSVRSLTKA